MRPLPLLALVLAAALLAGCFDKPIRGGEGDKGVIVRNYTGDRVSIEVFIQGTEDRFVHPDDPGVSQEVRLGPAESAMVPYNMTSSTQTVGVKVSVVDGASVSKQFGAALIRFCPFTVFDLTADGGIAYAGCGPRSQETGLEDRSENATA